MTLHQQNKIVAQELTAYPRGPSGSEQNIFRSVYQNLRMNNLGKDPQIHCDPTAAEAAAIRILRSQVPGFTPTIARSL